MAGRDKRIPLRFVGGHHDGLIMVCEHDNMVIPERQTIRLWIHGDDPRPEPQEMHCYAIQSIKGNKEHFHVMTPPSMDGDTLISKLIHGYNP